MSIILTDNEIKELKKAVLILAKVYDRVNKTINYSDEDCIEGIFELKTELQETAKRAALFIAVEETKI